MGCIGLGKNFSCEVDNMQSLLNACMEEKKSTLACLYAINYVTNVLKNEFDGNLRLNFSFIAVCV